MHRTNSKNVNPSLGYAMIIKAMIIAVWMEKYTISDKEVVKARKRNAYTSPNAAHKTRIGIFIGESCKTIKAISAVMDKGIYVAMFNGRKLRG